jgi:hypothetical protein
MIVRPGRVGGLAVLGLVVGAMFFMGIIFWIIFSPDFSLAYDISNPSQPFTFERISRGDSGTNAELDLSFSEILDALHEGGCAFVEGTPDTLDPERCVFVSQAEFMENALDRKLVFINVGKETRTLYVPVKDGHLAWGEPIEPP